MTELHRDPEREWVARDDRAVRSASNKARAALALGIASWVIGGLVLLSLAGQAAGGGPRRQFGSQAEQAGYYAGQAMCALFPAGLALGACLTGLLALRGRPSGEGKVLAWIGLAAGGIYAVSCCGGVGLVAVGVQRGWSAPARPSGPPLSQQEAQAFSDLLVETLGRGDGSVFIDRLDPDALLELAVPGKRVSRRERDDFAKGLRTSQTRLGPEIAEILARNGSYRLLRITPDRRAIIRLVSDDGLNYHVFSLARGADGKVSVADLHVLWGDLRMSESVARALQRTPGELQLIQRMTEQIQAGDATGALATWRRLQPATRSASDVLAFRLRAAQLLGGEEHTRALEEIESALRGQPGLDFILFDLYFERGEHDRCLRALDGIERTVQGDPYLDALRSSTHAVRGDAARALACARRAAEGAGDVQQVWWTLLEAAVAEQAHADTRAALERLADGFGHDPLELEQLDLDLEPFRASPEWERWEAFKRGRG